MTKYDKGVGGGRNRRFLKQIFVPQLEIPQILARLCLCHYLNWLTVQTRN